MIHLNCDKLATLTDTEFETLSFRLAILQGIQAPSATQATKVQVASSAKREHGPNVLAYLVNDWPDGKGGAFKVERFRLGDVARAQFASLETPLLDNEDIALACLNAGKPIGNFFTKGKEQTSGDCEEVETADIDEMETLVSSVSLDWD